MGMGREGRDRVSYRICERNRKKAIDGLLSGRKLEFSDALV